MSGWSGIATVLLITLCMGIMARSWFAAYLAIALLVGAGGAHLWQLYKKRNNRDNR